MPYRSNNYSFVIDSSFKPFTFQEMLAPYAIYKDEADKAEAALDALNTKAGSLKLYMDSLPEGSRAKETFNKYYDDLDVSAKDLGKRGLTMSNKRTLLDLKRRYAGEIGKIEAANIIRQSQIKEQHDAELKDPTMMFSREAKFSNFDDYLDNPDISYKSYSGALLATQVNEAATKIAKSLVDYINGKPLDGNTRTWIQKHGLTALEVAQAISNPNSMAGSKVLNTLMSTVIESSGIPEWADPLTLKKAYYWASQGLWSAIGEDKVGTYKLPMGRQGRAATSTSTAAEPPRIPSLNTANTVVNRPSVSSNNTQTSVKHTNRGYALGGSLQEKNLFLTGGPEGNNTQSGGNTQKVSLAPGLIQMLDQMNDSAYNAFIAEQAHTPNYTTAQRDSVLKAINKEYIEQMENMYLNNVYNEIYDEEQEKVPLYTRRNVRTTLEENQLAEDEEMLRHYGKYFYKTKNGNYALNYAGRRLYDNSGTDLPKNSWLRQVNVGGYVPQMATMGLSFKSWMDKRGLSEMAHDRTGRYQSAIFEGIKNRVNKKFDINKASEYYGVLDTDGYEDILARINTLSDEGQLPVYNRVKQGNSYAFKRAGKKENVSKLQKADLKSAAVVYGTHGNFLEIALKGGKKVYVPFGAIDPDYDEIVKNNVAHALNLRAMKNAGTKTTQVIKKDGTQEVEPIDVSIIRTLNAAYHNMVGALSTSGSKKEEVTKGLKR